jgi:hypothetical protein
MKQTEMDLLLPAEARGTLVFKGLNKAQKMEDNQVNIPL